MIKVPKKPGTQESYLRIIKYVYNKLIADIMLSGGKLHVSPLKLPLLFNAVF